MQPDPQQSGVVHARLVLRATEQAMAGAATVVHEDLKHGLNTLATLTCVAPLLGLFGTVCGISFDTFHGIGTDRYTALAAIAEGLSAACVPAALGLLVALQSLWCYKYFRGRLTEFDREMENESLALLNQLQFHLRRVGPTARTTSISQSFPFLEKYSAVANADRRCWRRSTLAATPLLALAWGIEFVCYLNLDFVPLGSALIAACRSVLIMFCCSCLPAYAVWVDLMHRKTTGLAAIAAALCLAWCAAGLVFPVLRF